MRFTAFLIAFSTFICLAAATPVRRTNKPAGQCTTGLIQCCDSVQSASSASAAKLLGLLGIVVEDLNIPVGITCSPISVAGIGGDSCSAAPVCCENNSFNGVVALGCIPISITL